jgi:hypothetical protein
MSRTIVFLPLLSLLLAGCPVGVPTQVVEDTWTPTSGPVDILWVVDDSGSMAAVQTELGVGFPNLLAPLTADAVDWQMGITTTDVADPARRGRLVPINGLGDVLLYPDIANLETRFAQRVLVGATGSDMERGLQAAWFAVTPPLSTHDNAGFLRPDAALAIIVVSDEDDCSDEGALAGQDPGLCVSQPQALVPTDTYLARLTELKGGAEQVGVYALVETGLTGEFEGCGGNNPGSRYIALARSTAGDVAPICGDFGAHLGAIGEQIAGLRRAVALSRTPEPSTLDVAIIADVEGALPEGLPEDPTRTEGWTYESASNTIRFWGAAVPAYGETVRIRYRVGLGE